MNRCLFLFLFAFQRRGYHDNDVQEHVHRLEAFRLVQREESGRRLHEDAESSGTGNGN